MADSESPSDRLLDELKDRLNIKRLERLDGSSAGGCISKGLVYVADNDVRIFVKTNGQQTARVMFDGELESLNRMLATKTLTAPKPLAVVHNFDGEGTSALAMEHLNLRTLTAGPAKRLGQQLADMHEYNHKVIRFNERASRWVGKTPPSATPSNADRRDAEEQNSEDEEPENQFAKHSLRVQNLTIQDDQPSASTSEDCEQFAKRFVPHPGAGDSVDKFGFDVPTSCGSIPQVNEWTDDWVAFYSRHRLDKAIRSLLAEHGDRTLHELWSQLQLKVDKFFVDLDMKNEGAIVPALLHGDLWSGNLAQLAGDSPVGVVYDPASFYGHNEYEFGIIKLFGGVCKEFFQGYYEIFAKKKLTDRRVELYELFHLLNHWDHFGLSYRQQSIDSMKNLLRYC